MEQRHDLIAASRFVDVDTHYGPQGFTENVVQQLEHAYNQGKILRTLKLYNRLATRHFVMKNGTPELAAMPIFPQHHGSHYLPIFVLPVRPDDNQTWHLAPSVGLRLQTVNVIFSVNLNSTDIQNWVLCKVGAAAAYMERVSTSELIRFISTLRRSLSFLWSPLPFGIVYPKIPLLDLLAFSIMKMLP
jgi:hypothetical protein